MLRRGTCHMNGGNRGSVDVRLRRFVLLGTCRRVNIRPGWIMLRAAGSRVHAGPVGIVAVGKHGIMHVRFLGIVQHGDIRLMGVRPLGGVDDAAEGVVRHGEGRLMHLRYGRIVLLAVCWQMLLRNGGAMHFGAQRLMLGTEGGTVNHGQRRGVLIAQNTIVPARTNDIVNDRTRRIVLTGSRSLVDHRYTRIVKHRRTRRVSDGY